MEEPKVRKRRKTKITLKGIMKRLSDIKEPYGSIQDGRFHIFKRKTRYVPAFEQRRVVRGGQDPKEYIEYLKPTSKAKAAEIYRTMINDNLYPELDPMSGDYEMIDIQMYMTNKEVIKENKRNANLAKLLYNQVINTSDLVRRRGFPITTPAETMMIQSKRPKKPVRRHSFSDLM